MQKRLSHLIFSFFIQTYKATADFDEGKKMYDGYSNVGENFLKLRNIVLERKQPRRMLVQANTTVNGNYKMFFLSLDLEKLEYITSSHSIPMLFFIQEMT